MSMISGVSGNAITDIINGSLNTLAISVINSSGTQVDPTQIRLLTSGDIVSAVQATAANLNATVVGTGIFLVQAVQSGTWTVQQGTPPWSVVGNIASGVTDSGNPIKIGGVFNTTLPTFTIGQRGDLQISSRGSLHVAGATAVGVAPANNPVAVSGVDQAGLKQHILTDSLGAPAISVPMTSGFLPDPGVDFPGDLAQLTQDVGGSLQIRGNILTDELSFRDDFNGSSLTTALTGTLNWTNASTSITGSGTLFTTEIVSGQYIKKTADVEAQYVQVDYVIDDTNLVLVSAYTGTTAASTGVKSNFKTTIAGGTITVGSSLINITAPNGNNNAAMIDRQGDYLPYNIEFKANVNQRVTGQSSSFGFQDITGATPNQQAIIVFDGTVNTQIRCRSSSSSAASDIEETVITLPNSVTTATNQIYKIDLSGNQATFLVNDIVVAIHRAHIPGPYNNLRLVGRIANTTGGTGSGTLAIDYIWFSNNDRIQTANDFRGEADRVQIQGLNPSTNLTQDISTDGNNNLRVAIADLNKTTYSAVITSLAPALLATDIFTITGSATKTIRVTAIEISAIQTTAGENNILIVKRSTANSAGASSAPTAVPHDSQNAAATATILAYTANPTLGTAVGTIRSDKVFISSITTASSPYRHEFGTRPGQAIVLRGITQVLSVNLNATTITGASFNIWIEWTEES